MMRPELYVGRSAQIVDKFCEPGGQLEKKLEPYRAAIKGSKAAELSV